MAKEELTVEQLAEKIFQASGGIENVASVTHCMTRVRMTVRDQSKVSKQGLQDIPGVLGVVNDEQLQVIIGPGKVNKVANAMAAQAGVDLGQEIPLAATSGKEAVNAKAAEMKAAQKAKQKQSPIKSVLKDISNIFVPMIPAFVGAGLVAGIASVMTNMITAGMINGDTWNYYVMILNILKNGMFFYLVIFTGVNAAQVFKANPTLGGVIGSVVLLTGMNPDAPITNLFTGDALAAGQGGIIGVIFAVWLLAKLETVLHRVIPEAIDIIVTPTLCLLAIGLAEIFLIMPLAGFISDSLVGSINWVLNVGGAFSGFVLGATFLPMVMFGLHQILTPIHIQMIEATGSTQLLPILAMAGAGQVGAAFALWIRLRKDKELSEMIKGALPVGILGIGEPLIYGVTLPLGRPFITACIGGGIGGAVIGALSNIGATAIGPSGVALIPLIANGRWLGYIFGLLAGYAGGFVATYFFGIPKDRLAAVNAVEEVADAPTAATTPVTAAAPETIELYAVAEGTVHEIAESSDPVFSQKMMGDGYFVAPENGKIFAPAAGTVTTIFPTKHAIGITTPNGLEILLHMGVDTVELQGKPFKILVKEGQQVTAATQIAEVDLAELAAHKKAAEMLVVLTNMEKVDSETMTANGSVTSGTPVMTLQVK
ncbi:glucose PTS transporter subunit IIA [Enterococcus sp.]|uniref:glucose PTS transporter subunit IIA n=1 Tax=Enterococcus sp. TaxID=35783 RepID=UPI0025BC2337|nr:glucose PTS transporter subunit IIA [Enterococcus sp.]